MIKSMILFALVSVQLALAAPDMPDCSKLNEVIEEQGSAQSMTTLNEKYKIPSSLEEFKKRCTEMTDAIKTLKKYNSKCNKALTQQVFSAILNTRSEMTENHCKEGEQGMHTFEAQKCLTENSFDAIKAAELKAILSSQVLYESNIPDEKLRLRRACCNVQTVREDFLNAAKVKCSKYEKVYSEYVDSYTKEAMGLICPAELKCQELEAIKHEGVQPKSKFFLVPMIQLVKTLDH